MSDKQLNLETIKQSMNPRQFAEFMREKGDVFYWQPDRIYVVTQYDLAKKVLQGKDYTANRLAFFAQNMAHMDFDVLQDFISVISKMMVMSDADEHAKRRRICYHGFSLKILSSLIPLIENTIDVALDRFDDKGSMDFVTELAQEISSVTLADFFAIPNNERMEFFKWANNMTQFFGGATELNDQEGQKVNNSAIALKDYFKNLIKQRRKQPKDDFLSIVLKHQQDFSLSDDDIISQAIVMLVAGQVTTTDQLCNNLFTLLTTKGLYQQLKSQPEMIERSIEELNRLDPAVNFIFRVAKQDTQLSGVNIAKNEVVFMSLHAINRDPNHFSTPNTINLMNSKQKHMSYGQGSHFCIGAKLARIQMKLCFEKLINRFSNIQLSQEQTIRNHYSLAFSGFKKMIVTACPYLCP